MIIEIKSKHFVFFFSGKLKIEKVNSTLEPEGFVQMFCIKFKSFGE